MVRVRVVPRMKRIESRTSGQIGRPDGGSRPNQETITQTDKRKTKELTGKEKKKVESRARMMLEDNITRQLDRCIPRTQRLVIPLLPSYDGVRSIRHRTRIEDETPKHIYERVLLYVERAWV